MFWEVIRFELKYRLNRPATYSYFAFLLLLSFLAVSWDGIYVGGDIGKIKQNASVVLFNMAAILSLLPCIFFASAVMGVPVLRDFEHKMESLIFSTRITKASYLGGRFIGSFIILLFISTGFVFGTWLGCLMPWVDQETLLDVGIGQYIRPWLALIVTNLFIVSMLFYATGALTRRMLFVYLQAMVLLSIYLMASTLIGDVENMELAALYDPFAFYAVEADTRYWTVAEKNTLTVPFGGYLLQNRLIWTGIALAIGLLAYGTFKFRTVLSSPIKRRRNRRAKETNAPTSLARPIPFARQSFSWSSSWKQLRTLTALHTKETIRSIPFLGIGIIGLILLLVDSEYANRAYGQELYPVTSMMAGYVADEVFAIIALMALFFAGEMIWKERQINFDQLADSLPLGYAVPLVSKYLAMAGVMLVYLVALIPIGAAIQLAKGFTHIEWDVYAIVLFTRVYISMLTYLAIMFFLQAISSNKFVGYALSALVYLYMLFADELKVYHNLLIPDSGSLGNYSDMNGYAAGLWKFIVLKGYWAGFSVIALALSILLYSRGAVTGWKRKWRGMRERLDAPLKTALGIGLVLAIVAGGYYQYNVAILNDYVTPDTQRDRQANYEKQLKATYRDVPQPSAIDLTAKVELYPENGDLDIEATVMLANLMPWPIDTVMLQLPSDVYMKYDTLAFSAPAEVIEDHPEFRFTAYKLATPLAPGDSMTLHVAGKRRQPGFSNANTNTAYVRNGTFINNTDILPLLGYDGSRELGDIKERRKRGLGEREGLPPKTDTLATLVNLFEQRGRANLDITIGTAADQVAISPGYLQRQWEAHGRAYYHYRMDKPIHLFFNIISGRYAVKRDKWNDVDLEVYYHADHAFNVDVMLKSLKDGLEYNEREFSPYSYRQMRIIEFPRYRGFAQSFANTVPFSESIGFLFKHTPDEMDMGYYVTAHELAHQWWGHQVVESNTKGNQMLSEGLAQYASLMLLKHHLPQAEIAKYLKYELDRYLRGRASEDKQENPLYETDGQGYIHYQKASLAYFALQDYIGEDRVNTALRKLIANYGDVDNYPIADTVVAYLREQTPDSLLHVVDDLFTKITLFENRVINPTAKKTGENYAVTIPVQTIKYYADSAGNEQATPIRDYIDIGVYARKAGKEELVYLARHKFTTAQDTVRVTVGEAPVRVGIDPLYKLVDRNTADNRAAVTLQ